MMTDYEKKYDEFWKELLEQPDGSINMDQLKKELFDFSNLMTDASKVYEHVTGGTITKIGTPANAIIQLNNKLKQEQLAPHPDYDFIDHDKVFVENADGTTDYFELYYEAQVAQWMLVPFIDKHFTTPKETDGKVKAEPLYAYGYELLQRVDDYDFEDLL